MNPIFRVGPLVDFVYSTKRYGARAHSLGGMCNKQAQNAWDIRNSVTNGVASGRNKCLLPWTLNHRTQIPKLW